MASDSPLMYYDKMESGGQQRNGPHGPHPERPQIRLSPEEIRVLKECNRESFYYRSVPFAVVAMAATHLAVKKGMLKPHPKWGSAIKQMGAGFAGWFLGKLSYRSVCEEKFLHLQNSSIGDAIRKKRGLGSESLSDFSTKDDSGLEDPAFKQSDSDDYHSSFGSLNLDTDKNIQYSGLDDRERPSLDSSIDSPTEEKMPQRKVTYEELRHRNRDSYEQQFRSQQSSSSSQSSSSPPQRSWGRPDSSRNEGIDSPKNKYGDAWER